MLWIAAEAIIAPLPPLWVETDQVPRRKAPTRTAAQAADAGAAVGAAEGDSAAAEAQLEGDAANDDDDDDSAAPATPRFLGDVCFVNAINGELKGEHPLLDSFRDFVKQRRTFGLSLARKYAHYDSTCTLAAAAASRC
jgi:hypothetical protein